MARLLKPLRMLRLLFGTMGALDAVVATLLVAIVLAAVGPALLGVRVFSAADLLLAHAPWKAGVETGFIPKNVCVPDTVDVITPARTLFGTEMRSGEIALRNPYVSGGTALGATPDSGVFSPIALPYLVVPAWLAAGYVKLIEMAVSLAFTFLFLRRLKVMKAAALLGGLLFISSGFMVVWTSWPQTNVAAFIPALFWSIERLVQLGTMRSALPVGLIVASMLLGGFPAVTALALYAAAAYLILRLTTSKSTTFRQGASASLLAGSGVILGILLAAFQLLPFVLRLADLGLERDFGPNVHLPVSALVTLAVPNAFGTCTDSAHYYFGPINEIEVQSAFGSAGLFLALIGLARRPAASVPRAVRGFFVASAAVAVAVGYVGGDVLALAQLLPTVDTSFIGRIRALLGFSLAVLAALGFDSLISGRRVRPRRAWTIALATLPLGLLCGFALLRPVRKLAAGVNQVDYVDRQVLIAGLAAVGAITLAACSLRWPRMRLYALSAISILVAAQAAVFALPFWPSIERSQFYPSTATHTFLSKNIGHERFAAEGFAMYPGSNAYYELRSVHGHGFTMPEWGDMLKSIDTDVFASPTFTKFSEDLGTIGSPILDRLAVRYYVEAPDSEMYGAAVASPVDGKRPWTSGEQLFATLPAASVRGVGVRFPDGLTTHDPRASVDVRIIDRSGTVVAAGSRRIFRRAEPGVFVIAVARVDSSDEESGPLTAIVTLRAQDTTTEVATSGGQLSLAVVLPKDDGLRVVHAADATVYERSTALPRIRWASSARVVRDPSARLALLAGQLDADSVVLSQPGPIGSRKRASVDVLRDDVDEIAVRVAAEGSGYLVVADAIASGWTASIDGLRAPVVAADHALGAVYVPEGEHDVVLEYEPQGRSMGAAVTALALVLMALAWLATCKRVRVVVRSWSRFTASGGGCGRMRWFAKNPIACAGNEGRQGESAAQRRRRTGMLR
jgi:hypothetical protein